MKCQQCGKENEEGSSFCLYCGTKLVPVITCPHCNALISKGDAFCMSCGWKVDEADIPRILEEKKKESAVKRAELEAHEANKRKEKAFYLCKKAKDALNAKYFDLALSSITDSLKIESTPESEALKDQILDSLRIYYKEAIAKATEDKKFSVARKYANEAQKYFSSEDWLPSAISEIKKKQDKKLYKSIGIVLLVFIGLIVIGSLLPEKDTSKGNTETSTLSASPENESAEKMQDDVFADDYSEDNIYTPNSAIPGEHNYHGTIDGKYAITVYIKYEESSAAGTYYYDKNGPNNRLTLEGEYADSGVLILIFEYNAKGKQTGTFIVENISDDLTNLNGTYVLESNGKEMPFELHAY